MVWSRAYPSPAHGFGPGLGLKFLKILGLGRAWANTPWAWAGLGLKNKRMGLGRADNQFAMAGRAGYGFYHTTSGRAWARFLGPRRALLCIHLTSWMNWFAILSSRRVVILGHRTGPWGDTRTYIGDQYAGRRYSIRRVSLYCSHWCQRASCKYI